MRGRLPKKLGEFLLFINIRFFSFYTFVIAKLDAKWKYREKMSDLCFA